MRLVPNISLKWKIFGACFILSLLILLFNFGFSYVVMQRSTHTGLEMRSHYRRYENFQRAVSRGIEASVDVWSTSTRLRDAFAKGDDEEQKPLLATVEQSLKSSEAVFVVLVDKHGDVHASANAPFTDGEVHNLHVFSVLKGGPIHNQILELKNHAYLINGAPILRDNQAVGVLLVGESLYGVLEDFRKQSDDDPKKQVHLSLVHNQETLVSTLDHSLWDDVARATRPEARETISEGGERVSIVHVDDTRYDFFLAMMDGYSNNVEGSIGTLYIMRSRDDKQQRLTELVHENIIVLSVALMIAGVVSFIVSANVTRPIRQFIDATRDLAHGTGDLTRRLEVHSNATEMTELADNLNAIFANLHQLASEVQQASFQVGASSAEISAASKQMLSGAKDQAQRIESSTAAVTEMSSSIQTVAENALDTTRVAQEAGEKVQIGVDGMNRIRATFEVTAEKIHELGESSKRIGNIVEVIRQISEQTSLLALNASIEAAHAGEQGRGFAVVADEVSSLARRVGQSAKDIEGLIGTITEQTGEAVRSMQSGTREVEEGTTSVTGTLGALKQIVDKVQDTARSVQEQAVVSDEIARNMDAVQKIAHEVLTSSEEAVLQGDQLHGLALKLEQLVRNFRIEREPPTALPATHNKPALPERSTERRRVARG
jgi:methyl-accepting chemotaxis protein